MKTIDEVLLELNSIKKFIGEMEEINRNLLQNNKSLIAKLSTKFKVTPKTKKDVSLLDVGLAWKSFKGLDHQSRITNFDYWLRENGIME